MYDALRGHDVALVAVDEDEESWPLVPTAGWGYLRLRRTGYTDPDLAGWADRIRGQPWTEAYAFLKHEEDSPVGPDAAVKLAAMV